MNSSGEHEYSHSSLQPKFKDCSLDASATPEDARAWIRLLSSIVRNIRGGSEIEEFLDVFLGREVLHKTRPAFLDRPELQLGPDDQLEAGVASSKSKGGDTLNSEDTWSVHSKTAATSPEAFRPAAALLPPIIVHIW